MKRDDLVEVPEYALGEERIAFGLTAPQLAILVGAGLLGALLNLLPLPAPVRLLLIAVLAGPAAVAAVLPIAGEPAYRWLLRAFRYWRSPKEWRPTMVRLDAQVADKPLVSGDVEDGPDMRGEVWPPVLAVTTSGGVKGGVGASGVDNAGAATEALVAPFPPRSGAARQRPAAEEHGVTDSSPARLRVLTPTEGGTEADHDGTPPHERSATIPYVLPAPRLACFTSFAGGVGKTTLAVESASLIAAHARYRTADGAAHAVRVLLLDASRLSAAAGLRLGVAPDALSRSTDRRDWRDPAVVARAVAPSGAGVDVVTLPPHPRSIGHEPHLPEAVGIEFEPLEADALRNGAHDAGYQLVVVDLGSVLEAGHRRLLDVADAVIGVVRPTLESLPDVLRLARYMRDLDLGRKLMLVANQCDDDAELRALAREAGVPLAAIVPPSGRFTLAADRARPAWRDDPGLRTALLPLARGIWPLDTLDRPARVPRLSGLLRRALTAAGRRA